MVLSPLTLSLVVASYTIVNLLDYVSNYIRKGALAVLRDICSSMFMISFTVLLFAYSAGFQQNTIARKMPEPMDFGALRQQLELGAMEWIAAEASEVDAPWLEAHPLFVEPDFRAKISRVCAASGSSVVSFFRSEWPEICRIEDIMATCSLNRVRLSPPGSYTDVDGISEVPFPYFFILHRATSRRQFDALNQILLRLYSAEMRGFLMRRYLTKMPKSNSPYGEMSSSSAQDTSFIALSFNGLVLLFIFFGVAITVSVLVFLVELTCLRRIPLKPVKSALLRRLPKPVRIPEPNKEDH